jgi:hypothetical protein
MKMTHRCVRILNMRQQDDWCIMHVVLKVWRILKFNLFVRFASFFSQRGFCLSEG